MRPRMTRLPAFFTTHRSKIGNTLLWLLVLVPAVGCALLMKTNCINQRFLDDWVWGMDLAKLMKSWDALTWSDLFNIFPNVWHPDFEHLNRDKFSWQDIFAVHLEHRPAFAKALALAATLIARGDVQAQCVLTFIWYAGSFLCLAQLWTKRGGLTIREAFLPLLLAGLTLFCPAQWQNMLWPICCETIMPTFLLLATFCIAFTKWPWWVRCLIGVTFAMMGMLSFASGILLFALPLPVLLWCGKFSSNRQRWYFAALWSALVLIFVALYFGVYYGKEYVLREGDGNGSHFVPFGSVDGFHTHFVNEAPPQYSNGQDNSDTMRLELPYFLANPAEAFAFVKAFCGAMLVRGWAAETKIVSGYVGLGLLIVFAALSGYGFYFWRDKHLRNRLLPMFLLALYTPLTGTMVAVGRLYHGGVGVGMNMRYTVHQTQLLIGMSGMGLFILRHFSIRASEPVRRVSSNIAVGACSIMIGVLCVGWIYGASMMSQWQGARFKDAAAQRLALVFPSYNHYVGHVAGNWRTTVETTEHLARYNMLKPAPLTDRKLSNTNYNISQKILEPHHGLFQRLYKDKDEDGKDQWHAKGCTSLGGSFRTPDAILFTYQVPGGERIIFGFTQAVGVPDFLPRAMGKDLWAIRRKEPWPNDISCPWEDEVAFAENPPPGALVIAWAVDAKKNEILRIRRQVKTLKITFKSNGKKNVEVLAPPPENADGDAIESLVELAEDAEK